MHKLPTLTPEFEKWAIKKVKEDKAYLEQRAKFGPEPLKSIAKLILLAAKDGIRV